jgi:hypothetical protein
MRLWSRLPSISRLASAWRRPKIASLESLAEFMAAQSAFVAQKCTIDYCQARSGLMWPQLEKEAEFRAALDRARWEAYPLVLSDVGVMIEGAVRPAIAEGLMLRWADWLADAYAGSLTRYGPPRHRSAEATWDQDVDHFRHRLGQAQMAAPKPIHEVGGESGWALHRLMPIHPSLTRHDATMICNNVRLRLGRVYEDLDRDLDRAAVASQLSALR